MVTDRVPCAGNPAQSYTLYLPSQYSPDRQWPVIYAFDPLGRGDVAIKVYEAAAEKYGYIVAASNNAANGPVAMEMAAAQSVWLDTHRRFALDKNRSYMTGLSGGARAATFFALYCSTCNVAGVISAGAGYPVIDKKFPVANDHFAYYAAIGDLDFNFPEVMTLRRTKDEQEASFKVKVYPGTHDWEPPAIAEDAIEWMELKAMQSSAEKVDAAFVSKMFKQTQAEAAQSEREGDALGEYYAQRSLVFDFKGLEEVSQFQGEFASLKASKRLKDARHKEQQEIELQASLTQAVSDELGQLGAANADAQPALAQKIAPEMEDLQREQQMHGENWMVDARAFSQLLMEGVEAGEEQFRQGNYTAAASYFGLMAEVAPDKPGALLLLADAELRQGDKKDALKTLEQAVQRGLKRKSLTGDPELKPLASDATFQEMVQEAK
ncbi:MAG: tetratricopeptide repeat protein [Acidobacteriaceae bacterium]